MIYNPQNDKILSAIIYQIIEVAYPDKIILFGSRSIDKQTKDSDYDVCVLKKNIRNRRNFLHRIRRHLDVFAPVDVIVNTPAQFEKLKEKWFYIYYDIHKFGRIVYER